LRFIFLTKESRHRAEAVSRKKVKQVTDRSYRATGKNLKRFVFLAVCSYDNFLMYFPYQSVNFCLEVTGER
jgi:hypothetical protein